MRYISRLCLILLACCSAPQYESDEFPVHLNTVTGPASAPRSGMILAHEHMLVDFIGADSTGYHRWNRDSAIAAVLPHLEAAAEARIKMIIDCTPAFIGRDPLLLKSLSEASGIDIITTTGLYGARDNQFLPEYAFSESPEQLAARWTDEFNNGIESTGVYPGIIKIGVNPDSLSDIHQKLIVAAAITHQNTGLTIASHTGPALPAMQQIAILEKMNVPLSAFIWVHAHTEPDRSMHTLAASKGAWISLDGVSESSAEEILEMILNLRRDGYLDQILLSHDAGWYSPGEPGGGDFRGFTFIADEFIPMLKEAGLSANEIDLLMRLNPSRAIGLN